MSDFGDYIIEENLRERNKKYRAMYSFILDSRKDFCNDIVNRLQKAARSDEVLDRATTLDLVMALSCILGSLLHQISTNKETDIDSVNLAEETLKMVCCFLSDTIEFRDTITEIMESGDFDEQV